MAADPKQIRAEVEDLRSEKMEQNSYFEEVAHYTNPRRGGFFQRKKASDNLGAGLYDETAIHLAEQLAAANHGIQTNSATQWMGVKVPRDLKDDQDVVQYLEAVRDITLEEFRASNFDVQIHEAYLDQATLGTMCMFCGEGDNALLWFETLHLSEVLIAEDRFGQVDKVYRIYELTARQAVQTFAPSGPYQMNLPKGIKKAAKEEPEKKFEFIHAVYPRKKRDPRRSDAYNMPYASVYLLSDGQESGADNAGQDRIISEGGFWEFPYIVARWVKMSGEKWGRSPAMKALPAIRMINAIAKTTIEAAQKSVNPALQVPDDGFLQPRVDLRPGGLNYYRAGSKDRIEIMPGGDPKVGLEMMQFYLQKIQDAFFMRQLELIDQPYMTAQEVIQRTSERDRYLGPILARQRHEILRPLMRRSYGVLSRAGAYPEPPAQLLERDFHVEYESPLAKSQRMGQAQGFLRLQEILAPFFQAKPEIMDHFNDREAVEILSDILGVPNRILVSREEVERIREQREQRMAKREQIEQAKVLGDTAKAGAQADATIAQARQEAA